MHASGNASPHPQGKYKSNRFRTQDLPVPSDGYDVFTGLKNTPDSGPGSAVSGGARGDDAGVLLKTQSFQVWGHTWNVGQLQGKTSYIAYGEVDINVLHLCLDQPKLRLALAGAV